MSASEDILFDLSKNFSNNRFQTFQLRRVYGELHFTAIIIYTREGTIQFKIPRDQPILNSVS